MTSYLGVADDDGGERKDDDCLTGVADDDGGKRKDDDCLPGVADDDGGEGEDELADVREGAVYQPARRFI